MIYIESITLCNIQSYVGPVTIPLRKDIQNRLTAPSEAGKTVLFKIPYKMVFPKSYFNHGNVNRLLRKGCSEGYCFYKLSDNTEIRYYCELKTQHFGYVDADGNETTIWEEAMPDFLIDKMGLIVDRELKIILNVTNNNVPQMFLATSPTWNKRFLDKISSHGKSEQARECLQADKDNLGKLIKSTTNVLRATQNISSLISYVDMNEFDIAEKLLDSLDVYYDKLDVILDSLKDIQKLENKLENLTDRSEDIRNLDNLERYHHLMKSVTKQLYVIDSKLNLQSKCDKVDISSVELVSLSNYYNKLLSVKLEIEKVYKKWIDIVKFTTKLQNANELNDCKMISEYLNPLYYVVSKLPKLDNLLLREKKSNENINTVNKELDELLALKNYLESLTVVYSKIKLIYNLYLKLGKLNKDLRIAQEEEANLRKEIKVCPTCNRPFEEESHG